MLTLSSVQTLNHLTKFYDFFLENEDTSNANKMKALIKKTYLEEYTITFCGHYSAGKSSLINYLLKTDVLPSSPIPTTANIVRLRSGEMLVKAITHDGQTFIYQDVGSKKEWQALCKNSSEIKEMEISLPDVNLPASTIIIDTPGIDSTDEAHFLASNSSIHLSDIIFYVVDYNHIQSEVNFSFTKQLKENGKEFVLIINQMDKHKEDEISLETLKRSVNESFSAFSIKPTCIFFISVKEKNWPFNELKEVQLYIHEKIMDKMKLLPNTTEQSFNYILNDHQFFMENKKQKQLEKVSVYLENEEIQKLDKMEQNYRELIVRVSSIEKDFLQTTANLEKEMLLLIQNAYIMPYQNRELAKQYLAALQKDFRIGLFSTKQKKEIEKNKRLNLFTKELVSTAQLRIMSPLILFFEQYKSSFESANTNVEVIKKLVNYQVPIDSKILQKNVNKHAVFSETYIIHYCEEIENYIKGSIKKQALIWLDQIKQAHKKTIEQKIIEINKKTQHFSNKINAKKQQDEIMANYHQWEQQLTYLSHRVDDQSTNFLSLVKEPIKSNNKSFFPFSAKASEIKNNGTDSKKQKKQPLSKESVEKIINDLQVLCYSLKEVTGFKHFAARIGKSIDTVQTKQYTICLFGAFSAGKSSFANALIDYPLLPVSPNPTTSSINRIVPVDHLHPHGSVEINWKTEEEIWMEVKEHLQIFQLEASSLQASIPIMKNLIKQQNDRFSVSIRYFDAFLKGYKENKSLLGKKIMVKSEMLEKYVANEMNACFIKIIDVFFDCELTRKGITLIDTPGGDSINSRHTAVSFDYIKEADCILYLSYYHHSFSKADENFLLQLGRIKQALEKDKMFFIINAIDLADLNTELEEVKQYMEQELKRYGFHHPRISSVSSMYYKKENYRHYMEEFQEKLLFFLHDEWMSIMVQSARQDGLDAITLLQKWLEQTKRNTTEKKNEIKRLLTEKLLILSIIKQDDDQYLQELMNKEIDEQLFYLQQRVFFRFYDFAKEAFHPSVLTGHDKKRELQDALQLFLQSFSYEFEQELRATSLRLEHYFKQTRKAFFKTLQQKVTNENTEMMLSIEDNKNSGSISFHAPFRKLDSNLFKEALLFYKNPKSFFEHNGRKYLLEELQKTVKFYSDAFLIEETERLQAYYRIVGEKETERVYNDIFLQITEYYDGKQALLTESENSEIVEMILDKVNRKGFLKGENEIKANNK
ncbi:MAG: dynamin family protein [Bacillus sp. (in: firmicutes)]